MPRLVPLEAALPQHSPAHFTIATPPSAKGYDSYGYMQDVNEAVGCMDWWVIVDEVVAISAALADCFLLALAAHDASWLIVDYELSSWWFCSWVSSCGSWTDPQLENPPSSISNHSKQQLIFPRDEKRSAWRVLNCTQFQVQETRLLSVSTMKMIEDLCINLLKPRSFFDQTHAVSRPQWTVPTCRFEPGCTIRILGLFDLINERFSLLTIYWIHLENICK